MAKRLPAESRQAVAPFEVSPIAPFAVYFDFIAVRWLVSLSNQ